MTFSDLIIRDTGRNQDGRAVFETTVEFVYSHKLLVVRVPKNFETDFASIPWILTLVFSVTDGRTNKATVVHDYLCKVRMCSSWMTHAIFRDLMRELKVPWLKRTLMFWAVYLFGPRW